MKIIRFQAENIKRIQAIDITPQDNVVIISGKNEQGKTSALDAIWLVLEYKAATKDNPSPLRAGTDKGYSTLDLGDYIVTRKFNSSGTTSLEVRTPDNSKITSPQKLLDGLKGDLSFDPWEFSRKNEKDQRQMLGDVLYAITEGKVDLADFDRRYQEAYQTRADLNREKKRLDTLITTIAPPRADEPDQEQSITQLTAELQKATMAGSLDREILDLTDKLRQLQATRDAIGPVESPEIINQRLRELENTNRRAREISEYRKIRQSLSGLENEIAKTNNLLELIEIEKAEALEASPLPVSDLKITADGVVIINEDGCEVPFKQASAARRLKISLAIAMAANPKLRVIRITDGSLLDDESLEIIRQMAKDKDFQVWVEYASRNDQDKIGIYIEDGKIVSQN